MGQICASNKAAGIAEEVWVSACPLARMAKATDRARPFVACLPPVGYEKRPLHKGSDSAGL